MSREMWYLTRATGIVAVLLMVAALAWGFFFSSRTTGTRLRPAWWLDLHNWLGGLALVFTSVHILASWLDSSSGIGLQQIFVPGTAALDRWGITWGVVAFYLTAAVVFTTWPQRLRNRLVWRVVHLLSIGGTGLALLHSYMSGTDSTRLVVRIGLLGLVAVSIYAGVLRLVTQVERRRRKAAKGQAEQDSQLTLRGASAPSEPPLLD